MCFTTRSRKLHTYLIRYFRRKNVNIATVIGPLSRSWGPSTCTDCDTALLSRTKQPLLSLFHAVQLQIHSCSLIRPTEAPFEGPLSTSVPLFHYRLRVRDSAEYDISVWDKVDQVDTGRTSVKFKMLWVFIYICKIK